MGWGHTLLWLVDVLVRVLLVPSLTLPVAHSVVHLASVLLTITRDAHLCKHNAGGRGEGVRMDEGLLLDHIILASKQAT